MRYRATEIWKSGRKTNISHCGDDPIASSTALTKGLTLETWHIANIKIKKAVTWVYHKTLAPLQLLNNQNWQKMSDWKRFSIALTKMLTMWLILPKWNNKNNELPSQPSELPRSQCFRYPDHVSLGYSLPPSGLIEIKRKSFKLYIFCVLLCPSIASHLGWNFQQLVVIW